MQKHGTVLPQVLSLALNGKGEIMEKARVDEKKQMEGSRKMLFPHLIKLEPDLQLIGSRCPCCSKKYFPTRKVCVHCFNIGLDEYFLSGSAKIKNFTIVHAKPPEGFPSPYAVGYIEMVNEELDVPAIITADDLSLIKKGMAAVLIVEPLSDDSENLSTMVYKFKVLAQPQEKE